MSRRLGAFVINHRRLNLPILLLFRHPIRRPGRFRFQQKNCCYICRSVWLYLEPRFPKGAVEVEVPTTLPGLTTDR